ncbi:hypothetical protein OQA88_2937 [Cercophora sp. LCS_1]
MPTYADHPFPLLTTPSYARLKDPSLGPPDELDDLATDMVLVHNFLIRALNSIHIQSPHISAADAPDFCRYMQLFLAVLHVHHHNEETDFFPAIETMAGEKGIMEGNVAQHQAFEQGVVELKAYVEGVLKGGEKYDGEKVRGMVDGFGPALVRHLEDEIGTLLELRRFGEKMEGVMKVAAREAEKGMKEVGFAGMVWVFSQLDADFEGGMWNEWPPAPGVVKFLARTVGWKLNEGALRFGAVDRKGKLRDLGVQEGI